MREILFRGKRVDDGKWAEGDLTRCVVVGETHIRRIEDNLSTTTHRIDPETICQYTGLNDKNRNKIFEGDICKTKFFGKDNGKDNGKGQNFADYDIFKIAYKDGTYILENKSRQFSASYIPDMCGSGGIEVIGNIFDNPELVKEDTENANTAN